MHHRISDGLRLGFTFRDKDYAVTRRNGQYEYTVRYRDEAGQLHQGTLSNEGYIHQVNGGWASMSPKDSAARAEALNSVVYFALLPAPLADPAAQKVYEGRDTLRGKAYHRLRVTFTPEGGGKDHDDVYLYWFDADDYSMDYLAYSFKDNGGGTRFRAATNSRRVNGILFQDYLNYRGPVSADSLRYIASLYKQGQLPLLSEINLSRISIRLTHGD